MKMNAAARVCKKFGGAGKLARLLGLNRTTVYKWTYPRSKDGLGGQIPVQYFNEILNKAKDEGIKLKLVDLLNDD